MNYQYECHLHLSVKDPPAMILAAVTEGRKVIGDFEHVIEFIVMVPEEITDPAEAFSHAYETVLEQIGEGDKVDFFSMARIVFDPASLN